MHLLIPLFCLIWSLFDIIRSTSPSLACLSAKARGCLFSARLWQEKSHNDETNFLVSLAFRSCVSCDTRDTPRASRRSTSFLSCFPLSVPIVRKTISFPPLHLQRRDLFHTPWRWEFGDRFPFCCGESADRFTNLGISNHATYIFTCTYHTNFSRKMATAIWRRTGPIGARVQANLDEQTVHWKAMTVYLLERLA